MRHLHATDVVSLVFGIILGGFTVVWLAVIAGGLDSERGWWAGPLVLVIGGASGVVASVLRERHEERELPPPT